MVQQRMGAKRSKSAASVSGGNHASASSALADALSSRPKGDSIPKDKRQRVRLKTDQQTEVDRGIQELLDDGFTEDGKEKPTIRVEKSSAAEKTDTAKKSKQEKDEEMSEDASLKQERPRKRLREKGGHQLQEKRERPNRKVPVEEKKESEQTNQEGPANHLQDIFDAQGAVRPGCMQAMVGKMATIRDVGERVRFLAAINKSSGNTALLKEFVDLGGVGRLITWMELALVKPEEAEKIIIESFKVVKILPLHFLQKLSRQRLAEITRQLRDKRSPGLERLANAFRKADSMAQAKKAKPSSGLQETKTSAAPSSIPPSAPEDSQPSSVRSGRRNDAANKHAKRASKGTSNAPERTAKDVLKRDVSGEQRAPRSAHASSVRLIREECARAAARLKRTPPATKQFDFWGESLRHEASASGVKASLAATTGTSSSSSSSLRTKQSEVPPSVNLEAIKINQARRQALKEKPPPPAVEVMDFSTWAESVGIKHPEPPPATVQSGSVHSSLTAVTATKMELGSHASGHEAKPKNNQTRTVSRHLKSEETSQFKKGVHHSREQFAQPVDSRAEWLGTRPDHRTGTKQEIALSSRVSSAAVVQEQAAPVPSWESAENTMIQHSSIGGSAADTPPSSVLIQLMPTSISTVAVEKVLTPYDRAITFGKDESNQVVVKAKLVSRHHCHLEFDFAVHQLNIIDRSTNGTLLNGVPVSGAVVTHGDKIQITDPSDELGDGEDIGFIVGIFDTAQLAGWQSEQPETVLPANRVVTTCKKEAIKSEKDTSVAPMEQTHSVVSPVGAASTESSSSLQQNANASRGLLVNNAAHATLGKRADPLPRRPAAKVLPTRVRPLSKLGMPIAVKKTPEESLCSSVEHDAEIPGVATIVQPPEVSNVSPPRSLPLEMPVPELIDGNGRWQAPPSPDAPPSPQDECDGALPKQPALSPTEVAAVSSRAIASNAKWQAPPSPDAPPSPLPEVTSSLLQAAPFNQIATEAWLRAPPFPDAPLPPFQEVRDLPRSPPSPDAPPSPSQEARDSQRAPPSPDGPPSPSQEVVGDSELRMLKREARVEAHGLVSAPPPIRNESSATVKNNSMDSTGSTRNPMLWTPPRMPACKRELEEQSPQDPRLVAGAGSQPMLATFPPLPPREISPPQTDLVLQLAQSVLQHSAPNTPPIYNVPPMLQSQQIPFGHAPPPTAAGFSGGTSSSGGCDKLGAIGMPPVTADNGEPLPPWRLRKRARPVVLRSATVKDEQAPIVTKQEKHEEELSGIHAEVSALEAHLAAAEDAGNAADHITAQVKALEARVAAAECITPTVRIPAVTANSGNSVAVEDEDTEGSDAEGAQLQMDPRQTASARRKRHEEETELDCVLDDLAAWTSVVLGADLELVDAPWQSATVEETEDEARKTRRHETCKPTVVAFTELMRAASPGATTLDVSSTSAFGVGDQISIGNNNKELRCVIGLGSFLIDIDVPLRSSYPVGATVAVVDAEEVALDDDATADASSSSRSPTPPVPSDSDSDFQYHGR